MQILNCFLLTLLLALGETVWPLLYCNYIVFAFAAGVFAGGSKTQCKVECQRVPKVLQKFGIGELKLWLCH